MIAEYSVIFDNCRHPPRELRKKENEKEEENEDKIQDGKTDVTIREEAEFLRSWVNNLNNAMNRCHQRILNRE